VSLPVFYCKKPDRVKQFMFRVETDPGAQESLYKPLHDPTSKARTATAIVFDVIKVEARDFKQADKK